MASGRIAAAFTSTYSSALRRSTTTSNIVAGGVHPHFTAMGNLRHAARDGLPAAGAPLAASSASAGMLKQHASKTPQGFGATFELSDDGMCFTQHVTQTVVPVNKFDEDGDDGMCY